MANTSSSIGIYFCKKYKRYLMAYIFFMEMFIVCGLLYNYSILFVSLQEEFGAGAALTGWVGSVANAMHGCSSPISAPLIHRCGPRMISLIGAVIFSAGLVSTSFVPALAYAYLTFGLVVGLGANFIMQAGSTLILDWFPGKSCSRGYSLSNLGSSFGLLVYAVVLNTLISSLDWRNCLRIVSGGSLLVLLSHCFFITKPQKDVDYEPQNINNGKDSYQMVDGGRSKIVTLSLRQRVVQLFHEAHAWIWFISLCLIHLGWTFVIINFASFMEYDLHFTTSQVNITFVLLAVGETLGKILCSICGDRLPFLILYVMAAGSLLGGAASGLMIVLQTFPLMSAISVFLGVNRALCFALSVPAFMELFGDYGSDIGTLMTLMPFGIGVLIAAPLSGGLYDLTGDYTLSLLVILSIFACAVGLMLIIPIRRCRSRVNQESFRMVEQEPTTI